MSTKRRWIVRSAIAALAAAGAVVAVSMPSGSQPAGKAAPPALITIASALPPDLNPGGGGAPNATLDQAAAFAWQEFISLNWPATTQLGRPGNRDTPASDCLFGDPACADRPLTWQTFRGKAEIFPARAATNSQPYDALPDYDSLYTATIPACPGEPPPTSQIARRPVWVNLDETSEIGLTAMYSGAGIPAPTPRNSAPQLIRFLAKANRNEFNYANLINARQSIPSALRAATRASVVTNGSPPAGSTTLVSLYNDTIEIKAGWRELNPATEDPSRFHTTQVRYYEVVAGTQCYRQGVWGLVSLHIIRKTASAPYFIYATFEQADNIRTAAGQPTEDADGNVVAIQPCRADQRAPCPTTPTTVYRDSPNRAVPPRVSLSPAGAAYCTPGTGTRPANRLYYLNTRGNTGVPTGGFVCINARQHPIPAEIIAANQAAHAAIAAYNAANRIARSPWSYYKLINVQYMPMRLTVPGRLYSGPHPATFYQSNSVVESNYTLQNFSGQLVGNTGTKTDYASQISGPPCTAGICPTTPALYYRAPNAARAASYDMGGCMGCHGTAQRFGGDFSFILLAGAVASPEGIPQATPRGAVGLNRARTLVRWNR